MRLNRIAFALLAVACGCLHSVGVHAQERPNILWITSEDNGPQLGAYGDAYADTPNLDAFAEQSLRYRRCWSNAPVCAPARTTLISGMYATSLGGEHMRSGVKLPDEIQLYPEVLREAGYYCTNNSKTDYNFDGEDGGWNESSRNAHWRQRPDENTPFFAIFNFTISHESKIRSRPHTPVHDPAKVTLPHYHPDTPEVRGDWAQYYDKMTEMDVMVGDILKQLRDDGLADSTIVFYYGDHGSGMPRSKRWPFDSGLRVPLMLHVPEKFAHLAPEDYQTGGESTRLVSFVDLGPTAISLAGVKPPQHMQGVPFAGPYAGKPKDYLFGYRGRMDERIDMVRCCTDGRYVYMRHFYPDRPYLKHVDYMFQTPTTRVWRQLFDEGKLTPAQAKFWQPKPVEELFDLQSDPHEVINLADQPEQSQRVATMRQALKDWMVETSDLGLVPEAEMHRLSGELPPRTWALQNSDRFEAWTEIAFAALDPNDGLSIDQLIQRSNDNDSVIRFWAVRGLAVREDQRSESYDALIKAIDDPSASVAIAACDGLLTADNPELTALAIDRLVELANVEKSGHFAAVAALNVLDMNAELDEATLSKLRELPRQLKRPPARVGKYVGRLLDHLGKQP